MQHKITLGIEEEFIVSDLNGIPTHFNIEELKKNIQSNIFSFSPEAHSGVLETQTSICHNLIDLKKSLLSSRGLISQYFFEENKLLLATGTHPKSHWRDVPMISQEPYKTVTEEYQDVMRSNYIFGFHLHLGIEDLNLLVPLMNNLREYIPYFLALSTNSPLWQNKLTGLESYRSRLFYRFPRTGIPDIYNSLEDYKKYYQFLFDLGCIKKPTSIWTDIRIHPIYNTIEIRVMDMQLTVNDSIAITDYIKSLSLYLLNEIIPLENKNYQDKVIIEENKWRAGRYGLNADFITKNNFIIPFKDILFSQLEYLEKYFEDKQNISYLKNLFIKGNGSIQQKELSRNYFSPELLNLITVKENNNVK